MSYPLPILNELHDLYPDLLYRPVRFQTSNHVIDYILEQSIHRVHREELARYQVEQSQREQHQVLEERIARVRNLQESVPVVAPVAPVAPVAAPVVAPVAALVAAPVAAQASNALQVVHPSAQARASGAPIPRDVLNAPMPLTQQQLRSIENFEQEMYGAVIYRPAEDVPALPLPISQASSFEQLLAVMIDDGIVQSRSRYTSQRPTTAQLERATTVRTLTENHDGVCSICHEEMIDGQHVRQIRHCNHLFHQFCIDTWFSMRSTCPTCRHDIRSN